MVQRKSPSKLGIQADHVKSEKRLGNLKPASCHHQDGKSRGPDMKKKIKRARSIKLSDIESLKSSSLRKSGSQPGRPPPANATETSLTIATSPKKQPATRAASGSPNYMKSTSCFEARKERSAVSSLNTQFCSDGKNLRQSCLKHTPASGNTPVMMLKKSSSLKLVRTLTKIPSFKPVRGTTKKCSTVSLCADMNVQKSTCSSTMKDSKFPAYLMLNPGGTEAEGTSVMKVCPYTYCSLNGHYHNPLPPLKCFLKARRRSLKTQKSMKLEILPRPRSNNTSGDAAEEIFQGLLGSPDSKAANQEIDLAGPEQVPVMQEVGKGFFIEIYEKHASEANNKGTKEDDSAVSPLVVDPENRSNRSWYGGGNKVEQDINKLGFENFPDQSPASVFNFVERFEEYSDTSSIDMDVSGAFPENQTPEDVDTECSSILHQNHGTNLWPEETRERDISCWIDTQRECKSDVEEDTTISDFIGMEWEVTICAAEIDIEDNNLDRPGVGSLHNLVKEVTASFQDKSNDTSSKNTYPINEGEILKSFQTPCTDAIEEQTYVSETNSIFSWPPSDSTEELATEMADIVNFCDNGEGQLEKGDLEINPQVIEAEIPDRKAGASDGQITETYEHSEVDEDNSSCQGHSDDCDSADPKNHQFNNQNKGIKGQNIMFEDLDEANKLKIQPSTVDKEQNLPDFHHVISTTISFAEVEKTAARDGIKSDTAEPFLTANKGTNQQPEARSWHKGPTPNIDHPNNGNHRRWTIGCGKPLKDLEDEKLFNPREPNFLPAVPDPDAEKVDLKQSMMDDRKNAEEWMIDYALQQAVTKLAPARKRKVALIVEAFESVLPLQKYDTHIRHPSAAFSPRPIQACS